MLYLKLPGIRCAIRKGMLIYETAEMSKSKPPANTVVLKLLKDSRLI
jgi:hypothetical protein